MPTYVVTQDDFRTYGYRDLKDVLRNLLDRKVRLFVEPARLDAIGLFLAGLAQPIGAESFDLPAGRIGPRHCRDERRDARPVPLAGRAARGGRGLAPSGAQVRLGEIARVEDSFEEIRTSNPPRWQGRGAPRGAGAGRSNSVAIANAIYRMAEPLSSELPPDAKLTRAMDLTTFIRANVSSVTEAIFFGVVMASLVVFPVLRHGGPRSSPLAPSTSVVRERSSPGHHPTRQHRPMTAPHHKGHRS